MCGIAGIVGDHPSEKKLDAMLAVQAHRGPDNIGKFINKKVAIGHNRLSIIDLSSKSNQPFTSNDGRYYLVFNGEIYNYIEIRKELASKYKFYTQSDTEVLLTAYIHWGKNCLHHFIGMFSFAIWDTENKSLFAARDRFGVKPFYYSQITHEFYFASEIKTLFAAGLPKLTNDEVWASYFVHCSYGQPNETFWKGIEQLPGGHYLTLKNEHITVCKWYDFEEEIKKHKEILPFDQVVANYEKLLSDSIRLRFRADVPVGFNLSGGLDSSTLLSFVDATQKNDGIRAFSFYTNDDRYDELPWVMEMLESSNHPLQKVLLQSAAVKKLSSEMAISQDEPFGGIPTIAYGQIFKMAGELGIKVLLDGNGMDEQWAGYDYYTQNNNSLIQGVKRSPFKPNVLSKEFFKLARKPEYPTPFEDNVMNLQFRDLFYTKIPRALRFNDRISMAYSTELREPFLDHRLVELAFSQPIDYKIYKGKQKYLLRMLVAKYLSDSIRFAPKRPLQTPQREWLGNELSQWVTDEVTKLKDCDWFDMHALDKELVAYFKGDQESSFHIWQWINTSLLLKNN